MKKYKIFLLILLLTLNSVYAVNLNTCSHIQNQNNTIYTLTGTLNENIGIDACLHIENSENISIYCNGNIVSGYTNRKAVWIEQSDNTNFYDCDFRYGDSPDGLVHIDFSDNSSIQNSVLHLHGAGNFYPGLEVESSDYFSAINLIIDWEGSKFPGIFVDTSHYGYYYNISVDSGAGGVNDGDGVFLRLSNFNNLSNMTSFLSSEEGFRIRGNNNILLNITSEFNELAGFYFESNNNSCISCLSQFNDGNGYLLEGDYNNIINSITDNDVINPNFLDDCGVQIEGHYNNIQGLLSLYNYKCSLSFEGMYNIVNDSVIGFFSLFPNEFASEGGIIKFEGDYNDLTYSFIVMNTSSKVFYLTGSNNEIFNNYIEIVNDTMIINTSPNTYNFFYRVPEFGDIIYPINNPNPFIAGNYWVNNTGGYSLSCNDNNHNGFCDTPFTFNGVNATDVYVISDTYECIPTSNLTIINTTPENHSVIVGESIFVTMENSFTYDSISGQNCSIPNGISFIDCHYNTSDGTDVDYWWGDMNESVYDTCIGIGTYECNNTIDWKAERNITSDETHETFLSCWTRTYYGEFIDVDATQLEWLPSTLNAIITPKGGTDKNLDFDTCNHFLFNNATICMSAEDSFSSSPLPGQQPILSCYDYNNDGLYEEAYILTGESGLVNSSCPGNPTIYNQLWNTTVCVSNDDLSDSGAYWGEGFVKLLVTNLDNTIGTKKEYVEIFDDISNTSLHQRPRNLVLQNFSNENQSNVSVTLKSFNSSLSFIGNALTISDPIECIKYTIVSSAYDPGIIDYCVYNNSNLKGRVGCNCENTSTTQGFYNFENDILNFSLYLDYNLSRYNFNMTSNTSLRYRGILGLPHFYTSPRSVRVVITESNGCRNFDSDFIEFTFNGICNDSEKDFYEFPTDYGGLNNKCGNCFDDELSILINESEIDYGGQFCGYCNKNTLKSNDGTWLLLKSFMLNNDTLGGILNQTQFGWVPFRSKWCSDSEETIASINAMFGSALLFLIFILFIILVFILFSLIFGISFWVKIILFFVKKKKKK